MGRIANKPRAYRSQLRAEQTDETRSRILDATVRVMATGIASLSIPAVADEAGVSIPTVYRHFGTKAELLAALYPHAVGRAAFEATTKAPESLPEFRAVIQRVFAGLDSMDDIARAAMASPAAEEARRLSMPGRVSLVERFVARVAPTLGDADRERITRLLVVLTSSASMRVWRDYFESSADRAADDVEWTLAAVIAAASRSDES